MREKKESNIQIGQNVRAVREQARLTQEQLAERIEVSTQYISDLERGVVGISIPTLKRLCSTLGISSDLILFGRTTDETLLSMAEKCRNLSRRQILCLSEIIDSFIKAVDSE